MNSVGDQFFAPEDPAAPIPDKVVMVRPNYSSYDWTALKTCDHRRMLTDASFRNEAMSIRLRQFCVVR